MTKDFYLVLGVPPRASRRRIKQAYRDLAKQHHPDMGGAAADPDRFRAIQQAYETLGDADRRAIYDRDLVQHQRPYTARHSTAVRPEAGFGGGRASRPSQASDRFPGGLRESGPAERRRHLANEIAIEMILEYSEALQGGLFPLSLPVVVPCEACGASGTILSAICRRCQGRSEVQAERHFYVHLPPQVENGTTATLPLDEIGLKGISLRLFIRVATIDLP